MKKPDWEAIESAYRAGLLSLREIASLHNISEGAIRKRAKRDEWSRDLSAKIKERSEDLVRKQEVRRQVRSESKLTERVLIESTAEAIANIRMQHRGDIRRAREIVTALFDELGSQCADIDSLRKLGQLMFEPDDNGRDKLNDIYMAIIALPERVKSVKALSEAMKNMIALERQAYDITDGKDNKDGNATVTISDMMDELTNRNN
ncbi:hypothetical protein [Thorsellia kenyensis]|uniref:Phage protein n=1 Tax=Thorsellia kenyensis TaxID=1549888 RepID=A0ABV6C8U5_9GAMM